MKLKILSVVAARPNFMKIAPFIQAINEHNKNQQSSNNKASPLIIEHILVHTGQHYDNNMSDGFINDLNIPAPDINLGIGSGSHAEQVGQTMIAFEKILKQIHPDWVVVVGDVNATMACSITAKKEQIKCCHIEAGLRSGDMTMPEEINRIVTDNLCDLLLTPDEISSRNLRKEGIPEHKIKFVGNIMIDTLDANYLSAQNLDISEILKNNLLFSQNSPESGTLREYALLTLHRPSNVDNKEILTQIVGFILNELTREMPVIWTIHPRTKNRLEEFNLLDKLKHNKNLMMLNPVGYRDMLRLNMDARIMLTDSGGLQEECTILGTPCLTLRPNTERPITLKEKDGVCVLVGNNINIIRNEYNNLLKTNRKPQRPALWDGKTAGRCLQEIIKASK
jgi:UDP-N-acetylglucosamine 2-epimerase (non-hydrolysing)